MMRLMTMVHKMMSNLLRKTDNSFTLILINKGLQCLAAFDLQKRGFIQRLIHVTYLK